MLFWEDKAERMNYIPRLEQAFIRMNYILWLEQAFITWKASQSCLNTTKWAASCKDVVHQTLLWANIWNIEWIRQPLGHVFTSVSWSTCGFCPFFCQRVTCPQVYVSMYTYIHMYTMRAHTLCTHACRRAWWCTCLHIYMHACLHTCVYACINRHTHTHMWLG